MEAFLQGLMARLLPATTSFEIHAFQGKADLLSKLDARLRGYSHWLPDDWRLLVIVDRDDEDCAALKQTLEQSAHNAGLMTRTRCADGQWRLATRIAIEELEAWYFGEWISVCAEFPRVPATIPAREGFRDSDGIAGGTWEAFERVLQRAGYFLNGLPKIDTARRLGARYAPERSTSASFLSLRAAIEEATTA